MRRKRNRDRFIFFCLFLGILWPGAWTGRCLADSAKERYFKADTSYRILRNDQYAQKERENWLTCIKEYMDVYRFEPDGPWAAAGLFSAGKLYSELYDISIMESDRDEAKRLLKKVMLSFPKSRYYVMAEAELNRLMLPDPLERNGSEIPLPDDQNGLIEKAMVCAQEFDRNDKGGGATDREDWMTCIEQFDEFYKKNRTHARSAEGLFMKGKLYVSLYFTLKEKKDRESAMLVFNDILRLYPDTEYAMESKKLMDSLKENMTVLPKESQDEIAELIRSITSGSKKSAPDSSESILNGSSFTIVKGLRFWSNPTHTRIVVDIDKESAFSYQLIKENPLKMKPQCLLIDMDRSRLDSGLLKRISIDDRFLEEVSAAPLESGKVRITIGMKKFKDYKVFPLKAPYRIVVDVWGESGSELVANGSGGKKTGFSKHGVDVKTQEGKNPAAPRKIVIDPGHGGKDYGAPGYINGVHEKQVVLDIALKLARTLEKKLKCDVLLTRSGDQYLSLEERTAFANAMNADLFISIHTNAATNKDAHGIETYYLNRATDDEAILVAARENATTQKNISDLQSILDDLMQNVKINESSRLAMKVHQSLVTHMSEGYNLIVNKGVKQAPFYVLLGAKMPSILIETSFISNERECKRLTEKDYQESLCEGISNGIGQYLHDIAPKTFQSAIDREFFFR